MYVSLCARLTCLIFFGDTLSLRGLCNCISGNQAIEDTSQAVDALGAGLSTDSLALRNLSSSELAQLRGLDRGSGIGRLADMVKIIGSIPAVALD